MCTAISWSAGNHYFGRNLDLHHHYRESVTITPRNFPFAFQNGDRLDRHYAIIGIATVEEGYPLYYDAVNEMGLCMAGLNFPESAYYPPPGKENKCLAPFELIPFLLSSCGSTRQAAALLSSHTLCHIPFSTHFPVTPLHWLLCDGTECVAVEATREGLKILENSVGVLTNEPPLPYHLFRLRELMQLTCQAPENRLAPHLDLKPFSLGMGGIGLPGDLSSPSRFQRAAFTRLQSVQPSDSLAAIGQFFHILDSVSQTDGCTAVGEDFEKTVYSCCCDTSSLVYYYTTYENRQPTGVHLYHEDLEGQTLVQYPLSYHPHIRMEN